MALQEIIIYRNSNEGFPSYKRSSDGKSFPLNLVADNIFKIREPQPFEIINGFPKEYDIFKITTTDGIPTYQLKQKNGAPQAVGGGGGNGSTSMIIKNQGIVIGRKRILNFTGAGVVATNVGGGQADILITGGGSSPCLTDVTYAQLVALIGVNGLSAGCSYRIIDYRTRELIPNTAEIVEGQIEPLIVQAISTNAIDETNVLSTLFPQDALHYQVINTTTSADDRGRIFYRIDTEKNVSTGYDWRVIVFRRWWSGDVVISYSNRLGGDFINGGAIVGSGTSSGTLVSQNTQGDHGTLLVSGVAAPLNFGATITQGGVTATVTGAGADVTKRYTAITPAGVPDVADFIDYFTFNELRTPAFATAPFCEETYLGAITDIGILFIGAPSDKLNNFILFNVCLDNYFEDDNFNSTIEGDAVLPSQGIIAGTKTNAGFFNNVQVGKNFLANTFGFSYTNNVMGEDFVSNKIGDFCSDNRFGDSCSGNRTGGDFSSNTVQTNFSGNIVDEGFSINIILDNCQNNKIGNSFRGNNIKNNFGVNLNFPNSPIVLGNVIGDRCFFNNIGDEFYSNIIGTEFGGTGGSGNTIRNKFFDNNIGNRFRGNPLIDDRFSSNIIGNDFSNNSIGTDFIGNQIRNSFSGNTIQIGFQSNRIGNSFTFNGINNNFSRNLIGDNFSLNPIIRDDFTNNIIGNDFFNNPNISFGFNANIIGTNFSSNAIIGSNFNKNTILDDFQNNISIGNDFVNNHIMNHFTGNNIFNSFSDNIVGSNFGFGAGNTIATQFYKNQIGDGFIDNAIGINFIGNSILNDFAHNFIDTNFTNNQIGNNFSSNGTVGTPIASGFKDNIILNDFSGNTDIVNAFIKNHIESGLPATSFLASVFVYADYTLVIEKANSGTYYGHYITDPADIAAGTVTYVATPF